MTFKALLTSIAAAATLVSAVFFTTVAKQAKWNRWAALVAGFVLRCAKPWRLYCLIRPCPHRRANGARDFRGGSPRHPAR